MEKLGPKLFVSVANAGILPMLPLLEFDPESVIHIRATSGYNSHLVRRAIENIMRVNVLGVINTHNFAARQMVKQGFGGRLVAAGSVASYKSAGTPQPLLIRWKLYLIDWPL